MKSNLSHVLPVWKACRVLGEPTVRRIVQTLLQLRTRGVQITPNVQGEGAEDATSQEDLWDEELDQLVEALFYVPNQLPHGASPDTRITVPTPPVIAQSWKKLTSHQRMFGLDKQLLFRFVVPSVCHPHGGPQGHMGLFDCWVYTLQGHATTSSATYYGGAASSLVWIPDVLIFLAVCQDYYNTYYMKPPTATSDEEEDDEKDGDNGEEEGGEGDAGSSETESEDDEDDDDEIHKHSERKREQEKRLDCLKSMAKLAHRFYDAYQKKGTLARDTLHRFLTDVYGEDSYKTVSMRKLLDDLFEPSVLSNLSASAAAAGSPSPMASTQLSEMQFIQRILNETPTLEAQRVVQKPHAPHISGGHVLLDWISLLGNSMVPPGELPRSTLAYLETMQVHPQPIISQYQLAETRLYEIKRRFHSLVESSAVIIQGDPIAAAEDEESGENNNGSSNSTSNSSNGDNDNAKVASTVTAPPPVPKHVITQSAFEKAVTRPNVDMGHGGYLPQRLAQLVFKSVLMGGSSAAAVILEDSDDDDDDDSEGNKSPKAYWGLYHVLKFGCEAVRCTRAPKTKKGAVQRRTPQDLDMPLLRQAFTMFAQNPSQSNAKQPRDPLDGRLVLDRQQIGAMLLLLLDHAKFRLKNDAPPKSDDDDSSNHGEVPLEAKDDIRVNASACALLGLLPPTSKPPSPTEQVPLKDLVDYVLEEAKDGKVQEKTLSLQEFIHWHYKTGTKKQEGDSKQKFINPSHTRRLGPLLLEMRLIASVLFGIPPTLASMEVMLVAELQRRHKYRYPPTDVSRRGPKGTVWYIIDHAWFQGWASLVKRVSHTAEDDADKRNDPQSTTSRGLTKINNTKLLAENGSLALRADIRWGHDYEILPPLAWSALQAWYDGGPPIHRSVVPYVPTSTSSPHSKKQPKIRTEMEMELYPFFVTVFLCDKASRGEARPFQQYVPISRVSPVRVVLLRLAKGLNVDPDLCRLWVMGTDQSSTDESADIDWLLDLDKNIVEQRNHRRTTHPGSAAASANGEAGSISLLLELKDDETGIWPRGGDGKRRSFLEQRAKRPDEPEMGDGVVGLHNMGNTCYLNSSIQCLSHTPVFREYFTSKAYLNDVNTTNPLGHKGQLAQLSAVLINSLWKRFNQSGGSMSSYTPQQQRRVTAPGSYCPVTAPSLTPKTFKDALGNFNEQFSGNEQHDAQELLAFLLDGLSEDLNRIVDKPYIEAPDSDGKLNDAELADIWWTNHLKREMSIIVALFTGQYKSLLTCRSCKYESARFEPFLYLQLPLPEDENISVSVVLYPLNTGTDESGKPTPQADVFKYSVRVRSDGNLYDVLFSLAKLLHADEVNRAAEEDMNNSDRQKQLNRLTSKDSENIQALEEIYHKRARNMAVVDMREGYISKVASNSWSLPDLQNKETGELPLLHVYELDPIPEETSGTPEHGELGRDDDDIKPIKKTKIPIDKDEESAGDDETSQVSEEKAPLAKPPKYSFLALAQRKSEVTSRDFLHPLSHRVFGTPLLLRIYDLEGYTGRDLYDTVAERLRNFVPKSALRFLGKDDEDEEPSSDKVSSGSARQNVHGRQRLKKTTTDMEEVSAGPVPRYGFRLRITSRDGRRCTLCPWYECCIGCLVPDDEYPTIVMCGDSIAVDWHFAVDVATSGFGQRLNSQLEQIAATGTAPRRAIPGVAVKNHSSLGAGPKKKGMASAISLEECLDQFAKEERIPEAYCSKCKDFRVQTKRMSLWRLPPVVIIHLKRFQFTQHMRRKLRDLVVFPVEGLDLSRIVASDTSLPTDAGLPDTTTEKQNKESKKKKKKAASNGNSSSSPYLEDAEEEKGDSSTEGTERMSTDNGRSVMLYDLYGVVHHQGALSAGHYVASIKSEIDGQWRLYNDAQVFEIHSRDVVDSSAYILFYIRRDVKGARLSDFWDTSSREGGGLSEQDMDKLLRGQGAGGSSERCVIS